MYYTYILLSLKDNKFYAGLTTDLKMRYEAHKSGRIFATKGRLPVKLIFYEAYLSRTDAARREKYFKTDAGKRTLRLMLKSYLKSNRA